MEIQETLEAPDLLEPREELELKENLVEPV